VPENIENRCTSAMHEEALPPASASTISRCHLL
jgi:hypothetical protein